MKVLLIGCGAVGLSLASALCASSVQTDLVARGATAEALREHGITRRGILGDAVIAPERIRVFESAESAGGGYDFILVAAKTTGNAAIVETLAARRHDILAPGGILVLCQNGFGNERAFEGVVSPEQIYHASFAIGFARSARHVSEVTVFSLPVTIGSILGRPAAACASLAKAVDAGGIPCHVSDEIAKTLWAKLLYNCALNPLSAILQTNYGGLTKSGSAIELMKEIIGETFTVMRAAGYETWWPDAKAYEKEFFEKILPPTLEHRSSTLQDMERKIPTEIDSLNGAVVRLGREYGVDTPCNTAITRIIKSMESLY